MKPGRTHWPRSWRHPCTLKSVEGAQCFFFPAGVDKTISLVSVQEALFCTYVSVNIGCFLPYALMSYDHITQTHTIIGTYQTNMHRFHRSNAAAHTPCVCDTPMCAVLLWLVVFVGVSLIICSSTQVQQKQIVLYKHRVQQRSYKTY